MGPLESFSRQLDFKPIVYGTFGGMSSNGKNFVHLAVDYGAEHLGESMVTSTLDLARHDLKRRYLAQMLNYPWLHGEGTRI